MREILDEKKLKEFIKSLPGVTELKKIEETRAANKGKVIKFIGLYGAAKAARIFGCSEALTSYMHSGTRNVVDETGYLRKIKEYEF